jgi:hypothetical protein
VDRNNEASAEERSSLRVLIVDVGGHRRIAITTQNEYFYDSISEKEGRDFSFLSFLSFVSKNRLSGHAHGLAACQASYMQTCITDYLIAICGYAIPRFDLQ